MEGDCPSERDQHGNTAVTSVTAVQAVLAATFLALCPPVQAQSVSQEPAYGLSGRIGLGVATVTAAQAQATSFSVYTLKSGCRKVDASVGAEYAMAPSWRLQANVGLSRLGDEAAASPLVGRRNGASAALAVAYEF